MSYLETSEMSSMAINGTLVFCYAKGYLNIHCRRMLLPDFITVAFVIPSYLSNQQAFAVILTDKGSVSFVSLTGFKDYKKVCEVKEIRKENYFFSTRDSRLLKFAHTYIGQIEEALKFCYAHPDADIRGCVPKLIVALQNRRNKKAQVLEESTP